MARIFWDTSLFIYLFEDAGESGERVKLLRERMLLRGDRLLTSTFTLGELLVKPTEAGRRDLCEAYEAAIMADASVVPLDLPAARAYAAIRQDRTIKPPDVVQLACASAAAVDLFITNDERLSTKIIPGIKFVTSLERATL
jgi:predicted nucleic acid-binding protein